MDARSLTIATSTRLPWALLAGALVLAAWALWRAFGPAVSGDPIATSLSAFEKQNRLTIFSAQFSPVVAADDARMWGILKSRQVAVIPARVDYTLDLSQMNKDRMAWDANAGRLSVTVPPLQLSRPNLDEARAQYLREGVWITGEAQTKLTRDNTLIAERLAARQALNPALMELAHSAAKDALRQNLTIPLAVAGYDKISIAVRFDGEKENE